MKEYLRLLWAFVVIAVVAAAVMFAFVRCLCIATK